MMRPIPLVMVVLVVTIIPTQMEAAGEGVQKLLRLRLGTGEEARAALERAEEWTQGISVWRDEEDGMVIFSL